MTNGQPLSVRAAIKPISTLTKPLRSVDTETKEPAQALRERTDSTVVPAAAVVAEAMVCLTLARCYREKFGGDHIDDVLAARRRLQDAHRLAWVVLHSPGRRGRGSERARSPVMTSASEREQSRRPDDSGAAGHTLKPALVFIGFMGAGKSTALKAARRDGAGDDRDRRSDGARARARRSPRPSRATARRPSGRARPRSSARCWRRPTAARSRSAAAASSPTRVRAALEPPHRRLAAGRRRGGLAADRRQRPPACATKPRTSTRLLAERAPLYEELADAVVPLGTPRDRRRGAARDRGARRAPAGDAAALGGERLGRVPDLRRPGTA